MQALIFKHESALSKKVVNNTKLENLLGFVTFVWFLQRSVYCQALPLLQVWKLKSLWVPTLLIHMILPFLHAQVGQIILEQVLHACLSNVLDLGPVVTSFHKVEEQITHFTLWIRVSRLPLLIYAHGPCNVHVSWCLRVISLLFFPPCIVHFHSL